MLCARRDELTFQAEEMIRRIIEHSKGAAEALHRHDYAALVQLDRDLETALGEKERALGALREHQLTHGCGVLPIEG
jgi:hypothetical protein